MTAVMLFADARRRQRVRKKSSIKFSLTGGHVDWITKTLMLRTLSPSCRAISPARE